MKNKQFELVKAWDSPPVKKGTYFGYTERGVPTIIEWKGEWDTAWDRLDLYLKPIN